MNLSREQFGEIAVLEAGIQAWEGVKQGGIFEARMLALAAGVVTAGEATVLLEGTLAGEALGATLAGAEAGIGEQLVYDIKLKPSDDKNTE